MPYKKGQSGNPKGRPKSGHSFAEAVRKHWPPEKRKLAIEKVAALAGETHSDAHARIKAFESLRKAGWPDEAAGLVTADGDGTGTLVIRWGKAE